MNQGTLNFLAHNERRRFKWYPDIDVENKVVKIPLGNSDKKAIINLCDLDKVIDHSWRLDRDGYAITNRWKLQGLKGNISMHLVILGKKWEVTDHINRDKLDNRRINLRPATWALNVVNQVGRSKTGYKGVYPHYSRYKNKVYKYYKTQIMKDGKYYCKYGFDTPEKAHEYYKIKVKRIIRGFFMYGEQIWEEGHLRIEAGWKISVKSYPNVKNLPGCSTMTPAVS